MAVHQDYRMTSRDTSDTHGPRQRKHFPCTSSEETRAAVEAAFDYRGDVTLELADGTRQEGYVFNQVATGDEPFLEFFPRDGAAAKRVLYRDLAAILFTGVDTAEGKSWEAWQAKVEEAKRNGTFAELYPESLED